MPKAKVNQNELESSYVRIVQDVFPRTATSSSILKLKQSIKKCEKTLQDKFQQLTLAESKKGLPIEKFKNDLKMIQKHKQVIKVEAKGNVISVYTKDIYLNVEQENGDIYTYKLGKFRIEFERGNRYFDVFINNMDSKYRNMYYACNAPHVNECGEPCFGNIGGSINKLLGAGELYAATILIIRYLESFNKTDRRAWDYLNNFPIVEKG